MTTLLVILWVIKVLILLVVAAVRPERTAHSRFELMRRGDKATIRRERLLSDIIAMQQFILLVFTSLLAINSYLLWGLGGVLYTIITLLIVLGLSRTKLLRRLSMKLYKPQEPRILTFVEKAPLLGKMFGSNHLAGHDLHLESTEQLSHLVETAGHILSHEQQGLIKRGLEWHQTLVGDVMTPRESIDTVKASELLGPLVLNDLHQTGHTVFPVTKQGIDHIIGVLDIADHLRVDKGHSSRTAEQAMIPEVFTVLEDAPLPVALQLLLSTRHPFLVVMNDSDKTAGLVTMRDVIGALLGKNI